MMAMATWRPTCTKQCKNLREKPNGKENLNEIFQNLDLSLLVAIIQHIEQPQIAASSCRYPENQAFTARKIATR
jgi:hypothetical protein